jgi:phosphoglycolate phosphatase-like HAD superfamily hydrolase
VPKAAIFDLDGTFFDSVDLHAIAWHEAIVKFGHDAASNKPEPELFLNLSILSFLS